MTERRVRYEPARGLAQVTLARPAVRNALDLGTLAELVTALDEAAGDDSVNALLLDAEGPAFCAGMDLKSVDLGDAGQARDFARALSSVYLRLMTLRVPVLCAVDGPVSGGGVGLVASADLVWAGPGARFGLPETRLGLVPAIVSVPLARRVGQQTLRAMALGGVTLDADAAAAHRLVDFHSAENARDEAHVFAAGLLQDHAPGALARTRRFLGESESTDLAGRLEAAAREFEEAVTSDEARRGLEAFRKKETVRWNGA